VATVIVFVLAMVLHPEVQAKAQAEIDSVLGGCRLPEMSDRESLPYVCCIVKEVLRWWPAFPLGEYHKYYTKFSALNMMLVRRTSCIYPRRRVPRILYTQGLNHVGTARGSFDNKLTKHLL
jgi:hypothetical protein